jgi:predicted ribosomally synthesized peptide with SipW-like signal peptide
MHRSAFAATGCIACLGLAVSFASFSDQQAVSATPAVNKEEAVTTRASGTFDVKLTPQTSVHGTDESHGRLALDKQFQGDLVGVGKGEMLTAGTSVKNSAVYVAIERVTGTLHGKRGTFTLHHVGIMDRGTQQLSISVVPDSGTDQLIGITGTMKITITDGKHLYDFDYTLPNVP